MPKLGPMGREMTMISLNTADRVRTLERLRDRLAEQLDVVESSRDVCALARRLQAVLKEIDDLPQSRPVAGPRLLSGDVSVGARPASSTHPLHTSRPEPQDGRPSGHSSGGVFMASRRSQRVNRALVAVVAQTTEPSLAPEIARSWAALCPGLLHANCLYLPTY